ncbi:syntaxin-16-like [Corticium candelabrum]|uniref:syntaxin-16-like n=1 Tax=Corticium candelabrum TaxID=121492 RepID=UPI002E26C2D0|nr:syntaxin-16-like [Corticium candelabrum]
MCNVIMSQGRRLEKLVTRSHTEVFLRFRSSVLGAKQSGLSDDGDDRVALVRVGESSDAQFGRLEREKLPPEWTSRIDEISLEITRIKQKMNKLSELHDEHMYRPSLDDTQKEHEIEIMTKEITEMFHRCQKSIRGIGSRSKDGSKEEQVMARNVMSSLAASLQELSISFRKGQSNYLRRMKNRESQWSDMTLPTVGAAAATGGAQSSLMAEEQLPEDELYDRGFTDHQLMLVEDNTEVIEERERQIRSIVESISQLNEIFRDLATMIVEQGTVLDRIDYNIEQTSTSVEKGLQQLEQAEKTQRKSRKTLCIIVLAVVVIVMLLGYIIFKVK